VCRPRFAFKEGDWTIPREARVPWKRFDAVSLTGTLTWSGMKGRGGWWTPLADQPCGASIANFEIAMAGGAAE
jgi:hypothetical protein